MEFVTKPISYISNLGTNSELLILKLGGFIDKSISYYMLHERLRNSVGFGRYTDLRDHEEYYMVMRT